ncbi:MAG: HU family DNA-binding protein [Oligoflexales bacterium]
MNKTEFAEHLAETMETSKTEAARWLDAMIEGIHTGIKTEEGVKLAGLGSFSRTKRNARTGRNPQTGEEIKIPAKWVPTFKAASQLKEIVQKKK